MSGWKRLRRDPGPYERAWLASINGVGLVVGLAVLFDLTALLGTGQTGIFRRALYPLVPPAATLGVAVGGGRRRGVALSGTLLAGYVAVLVAVGTAGQALASAPVYVGVALSGTALLVALGYTWTRLARA